MRNGFQTGLTAAVDLAVAAKLAAQLSAPYLLRSWVYVPAGIVVMLVACFGVDVFLKRVAHVSFPASVACLVLLFLGLLLCELLFGGSRTRRFVHRVVDVPTEWSLRWISVFFTPTFVMLPLSNRIGVVEVFKLIAVFVIGFIVMMVLTAYMTRSLQLLTGSSKRARAERLDELGGQQPEEIPTTQSPPPPSTANTPQSPTPDVSSRVASSIALDTLAPHSPLHSQSQDPLLSPASPEPYALALQAGAVYRQKPTPPPRAGRLDELGGQQHEEMPTSQSPPPPSTANTPQSPTPDVSSRVASSIALDTIAPPPPLYSQSQDPLLSSPSSDPSALALQAAAVYRQTPIPPSRARRWAAYIAANIDWLIYTAIATTVGLPVFYATGYAMPLHTSVTVLSYFAALRLPNTWRHYLHPVLVSALLTVVTIWLLGLTQSISLTATLTSYRTGLKYLSLWEHTTTAAPTPTPTPTPNSSTIRPGAGDIFSTALDVSIVSLALPMYQYRRSLRAHFAAILVPNMVLAVASLFAYPPLCFAVGIAADRSLAFAARSLTLALAIPATENLGGDVNTVSAVAIMSGVVGALVGGRLLDWMGIPEDDYVTRGVTLGANSSAVATALLLQSDPRAAALSSLSMTLFGTITVLFTAVPVLRDLVRSMVGL
ncbi:LrgB-like family-domain-containing protein [Podospora appendiculata]|uniref:LrgB-like family-domain-containing protein n=1 Tax=Podospora appendiculata TaxID=314037 RepID=A0AAE1CDE6_9PEZI|nr:LrgB-like family-domain-containing protein [Podospora appendiculata]